jgi:hypothetical protein
LQLAQTYGDSRLDRLEAAGFDRDSIMARQQESNYGIETSSDGVYAELEPPDDSPARPLSKSAPAMIPPRRADYGVFGAAALLIGLVIVTTLLLAWAAPNHSFSFLKKEWDRLNGVAAAPAQPQPKPFTEKENTSAAQKPNAALTENPPAPVAPVIPSNTPATPAPPAVAPGSTPVLPVNPSGITNAGPSMPVAPIPALAAIPDSAFVARDIAEKSLPPADIAPTGKAELLKIIGKRDETQITPTTWTFYFLDKSAAGHARIVTVNGEKVTKTGEDLVDFASPYAESDVLPEEQIQKDSTDALQIAQGLIPGVTVIGSEFTLMQQKNSVPMWRVTLWSRNASGEEHKLGDVILLAENGTLIKKNLEP